MAITKNITIDQGSTISIALQALTGVGGDPIPLEDGLGEFTVNAEIKLMFNAYTSYPFTVDITDAAEGEFELTMDSELSSTIEGGRYVYDVEIVDNAGRITRIYEGLCVVKPQVTTENPYVNVQGIKQFAPDTVHKHGNKQSLDRVQDYKAAVSPYTVVWGDKLLVDGSTGVFELIVPEAPVAGFEFEFIDVLDTFPDYGVEIKDNLATIETIVVGGYYKAIHTGVAWKIIKVG